MLAALALGALGCGARYARLPLVDTPDLGVVLRSESKGGALVPRGFAHPATLSAERAASILARIDVRESAGDADERRPAIPGELADDLGAALADALGRADANQEVAIRAQRRERRLGVFTRRFATSFVAFVDDRNRLQIHVVEADRELPAGDDSPVAEPIPGRSPQAFKTLPGPHVEAIAQRAVAVDWRAPLFEAPPARGESGRRRTILLESGQSAAQKLPPETGGVPADPERLRALADLETARRAGTISEAEYQRQRDELLRPSER
jgi:hypothetical protein